MKTAIKYICLSILLISGLDGRSENVPVSYLERVLNNLNQIQSAVYHENREAWRPGEQESVYSVCREVYEYNNPADTTIGASYVSFECDQPKLLDFAYDGKVKAVAYNEDKKIVVDNFTVVTLPFRVVGPPFFNYTKNIIQYVLTTGDSISLTLADSVDHVYLKLVIHEDNQIEFFGKGYRMPNYPGIYRDPTSRYEIWINKSTDLPYKVRREMAHDISATTCLDVEFGNLSAETLNIYDYFPSDYEVRKYRIRNVEAAISGLVGEKASDWILNDANEQPVSLSDYKGKVMLIQFTGIGCGPCIASIPFLNELKDKYDANKFGLVAIETWVRKPVSLQNYIKKNEINYPLLSGTDEVANAYNAGRSAPLFFILDDKHIIKHVFIGYNQETKGQEIVDAINELL